MSVAVCILAHGAPAYVRVAREAVLSVVRNSDFDVFVTSDCDAPLVPSSPRVIHHRMTALAPSTARPYRFLRKLEALRDCLVHAAHDVVIALDADAVLARRLTEAMVDRALGAAGLGMVEQKTITGSAMNRAAFLEHYRRHALPVILPGAPAPALARFRYYNSGVVVLRRAAARRLAAWAVAHVAAHRGAHEIGDHMIADQDYFQVWANNLHPGDCVELPWYWNHCEHWDRWFPRPGVLFAHFSNFCRGPDRAALRRMRALRRPHRVVMNELAARFVERRSAPA